MRTRKYEISILNLLLCFQVIFIHVSSATIARLQVGQTWYDVILCIQYFCQFAVPGFFMLSGLKMMLKFRNAEKLHYFRFLWSRFKGIILPYAFWVVMYYLYFANTPMYSDAYPLNIGKIAGYILNGDLAAHFYFVIVIVQFYLLMPLWVWLMKRCDKMLLCAVAVMMNLLFQFLPDFLEGYGIIFTQNADLLTNYIAYWMIGCCIGWEYERYREHLSKRWAALLAFGLLSAGLYMHIIYRQMLMNGVELVYGESVHIIMSVLMPLGLLAAFINLAKLPLKFRWCRVTDSISYNVYLMHCLFLYFLTDFLHGAGIAQTWGQELLWRALYGYVPAFAFSLLWYGAKVFMKKLTVKQNTAIPPSM